MARAQIVDFLEDCGRMDSSQHGARAGRSTVTQLLLQYRKLLTILEKQENAEVIFLDFSKAFDVIDHSVILGKLSDLGIRGQLLKC